MGGHRFIGMSEAGASRREAEERVMGCLVAAGIRESKSALLRRDAQIKVPGTKKGEVVTHTVRELTEATRANGVVPDLDRWLWSRGRLHLDFSTDGEGARLGLAIGDHEKTEVLGPGFVGGHVVEDLLDDIGRLRRLVAEWSIYDDQFKTCASHWRTYLASCVSVLDAFVSLGVWWGCEDGLLEPDCPLHNHRQPLETKLEQWHETFGAKRIDKGQPWNNFQVLKRLRDEVVHPKMPTWAFSARTAVDHLNLCRLGVGQLMIDACRARGRWPSPALLAVRYAPEAVFLSKHGLQATGKARALERHLDQ